MRLLLDTDGVALDAPAQGKVAALISPADASPIETVASTAPALQHVWQSRFGPMLIEVVDGVAFVNGEQVEPVPDTTNRRPR
jgi:hypothetical protein